MRPLRPLPTEKPVPLDSLTVAPFFSGGMMVPDKLLDNIAIGWATARFPDFGVFQMAGSPIQFVDRKCPQRLKPASAGQAARWHLSRAV